MSPALTESPASGRRQRPARTLAPLVLLPFAALLAWGVLSKSNGGIDADLAAGRAPLAPSFELPLL